MKIDKFKKLNLPEKPGVYFFLGTPKRSEGGASKEEILYIGKATSLKDRVRSYFGKDLIETRGPLLVDMVFKASDIKWQETDSVLEALILEANLIKKHQPYYNTKEKDDKSFNYVCITKDELPKILTIRGRNLVKNKYKSVYGPYPNGGQLTEALKIIRKIFPYLDDRSKNYHEFYKQINLAPDLEKKKEYLRNIRHIQLFFEGKKKMVLKNLAKEMKSNAKAREFEKAGIIKRQIFSLNHINDVALIKEDRMLSLDLSARPELLRNVGYSQINPQKAIFRIEAYDIAHMSGKNMVGVMTVVENGEVNKSEYKKFKIRTQSDANDTGALKEVLERRLAHHEWQYPRLIVVDGSTAQMNTAKKVLATSGIEIPIVGVVKDERHRPKNIIGDKGYAKKYDKEILLANNEAHRFAINYHKNTRNKNFIPSSLKLRRTIK